MNINNDEINMVEESVSGKIGQVVRGLTDTVELKKKWNKIQPNKKYSNSNLSDEEYDKISKAFSGMRNATAYSEYKKHYQSLCSVTGIPTEQVVIVSYSLKRDKEKSSIEITYNTSPKKIIIPNGSTLYHMSENHTITELVPQFKGKSAKSYLYSSPRVYFTLKKTMNKFAADIKKQSKVTTYSPTENIQFAWIDPLVPAYSFGAVYVETNSPIKVEVVSSEVKESVDDDVFTEPSFVSLEEFMEYYGLEYAPDDDELYIESLQGKVGEVLRNMDGKNFVKNVWKNATKNIRQKEESKQLSKKDKDTLKSKYETISTTENFTLYKTAYAWICKFFNLPPKSTIIENIDIDDEEAKIRYNVNDAKKIIIPNDTHLLHVSPADNITELKPSFRSKVKGKYLYPSKRVYFTLGKSIPGNKAGLEKSTTTKYTPKETIKTAYIDPACTNFNIGAIFVPTSLPIPVEKINETKPVKESSLSGLDLFIYESFMNDYINETEMKLLLEILGDEI